MTTPYATLIALASDMLTVAETNDLGEILKMKPFDMARLVALDQQLGGPGFWNVNCDGRGRYDVLDADIFRPLQYCGMYFTMAYEGSEAMWLTRTLVHMSSLHIEGLVKRLVGSSRHPLGRVLRDTRVRRLLAPITWSRIARFTPVYNDAKHAVHHLKDTHLFSIDAAILAYLIARKLATDLYPLVHLKTDLLIFDQPCL